MLNDGVGVGLLVVVLSAAKCPVGSPINSDAGDACVCALLPLYASVPVCVCALLSIYCVWVHTRMCIITLEKSIYFVY